MESNHFDSAATPGLSRHAPGYHAARVSRRQGITPVSLPGYHATGLCITPPGWLSRHATRLSHHWSYQRYHALKRLAITLHFSYFRVNNSITSAFIFHHTSGGSFPSPDNFFTGLMSPCAPLHFSLSAGIIGARHTPAAPCGGGGNHSSCTDMQPKTKTRAAY